MTDSVFCYSHDKMLNDRYWDIINQKSLPAMTQEDADNVAIRIIRKLKE